MYMYASHVSLRWDQTRPDQTLTISPNTEKHETTPNDTYDTWNEVGLWGLKLDGPVMVILTLLAILSSLVPVLLNLV